MFNSKLDTVEEVVNELENRSEEITQKSNAAQMTEVKKYEREGGSSGVRTQKLEDPRKGNTQRDNFPELMQHKSHFQLQEAQ